jgi:UMF1 family MFS transporter
MVRISDGSLPARIFIGWYLVDWFAQITFILPIIFSKEPENNYIFKGLKELKVVLNNLKYLKV